MEFVIVTGLSGSGKSSVMKALEDIGFFCIDNMPPQLIPDFAAMCNENAEITKVAIVTDIRGGAMFFKLEECITKLHIRGIDVKVLFLEASREVLMKRHKETAASTRSTRYPAETSARLSTRKRSFSARYASMQTT